MISNLILRLVDEGEFSSCYTLPSRSAHASDCVRAVKIHRMGRSGVFVPSMILAKQGPGSALHNKVHKLRLEGFTLVEIAKEMGFSVNRARRILAYPKTKARDKLREAVKSGRITKPSNCQRCGSSDRVQGHHTDYSKPLDVEWLCHCCHVKIPRGPYPIRHLRVGSMPKVVPVVGDLIAKANRVTEDWKNGCVNKSAMEDLQRAAQAADIISPWCSDIVVKHE